MSTDTATGSKALIRGSSPTVFVSDLEKAVQFYTKTLGLSLQFQAGEHFAIIDTGSGTIGLHPPGDNVAAPGTRGCIQIGLDVAQPIDEVVEQLRARGVAFQEHEGRVVVNDGGAVKLAFFHDQDGTELYLCEVQTG